MAKVVVDISMSLDGFVTAPGARQEHGLRQATAATGTAPITLEIIDVVDTPRATHLSYRVTGDAA